MSKYLLALDQSTQVTGYAIFIDGKLLKSGAVSPSGSDYLARIVKLRQWLKGIIDTLDKDLTVVIEDIQLQEFEPNGGKHKSRDFGVTTFKKLAHVQGALLSLLEEEGIKYNIVLSSSWKKTCGVAGRCRDDQKKNAQAFVQKTYGLTASQDEADAICLAHHQLNISIHDWT